ncbi:MAG: RIP metalloprotease RseP [Ruminococcus sp.]|nr:RIP metalloprotease RseP [Ruminococcus sp.]
MTNVLSIAGLIIIGVLLFELIIFFHEGGHYLTAKRSGIKVNEFALGMGPKIFSFTKGETTYSLRLLPIGGYCSMEGEDEDSDNSRAFNNAKIWKRMIVIIAGAVMNMVLGIILMFVIVVQQPAYSSLTVDDFQVNSFSANSGLQAGDQIIRLNNYNIWNSRDLSYAIGTMKVQEVDGHSIKIYKEDCTNELTILYQTLTNDEKNTLTEAQVKYLYNVITEGCKKINQAESKEDAYKLMSDTYTQMNNQIGISKFTVPEIEEKDTRQRYVTDITVIRNGEQTELKDVDFFTYRNPETDAPSIAIDFYVKPIEKTFTSVISETFGQTVSVIRMTWSSLAGLVTGQFGIQDISGPVGITSAISQVASAGLERSFMEAVNNIILVMVIITINLGIVNMLPFPALDGGRFVLLLIEGIFKKPIPRKVESYINAAGLVILLLFMVLVSVKDIWQLVGG